MTDAELPELVYHYTDIFGLQGVYEKSELWATNSSYLNDTSELEIGLIPIEEALLNRRQQLYEDARARIEATSSMLPMSELGPLEATLEVVRDVRKYSRCYVVSLSENRDQLSQWRAYTRAGYCIGFSTETLLASLTTGQRLRRVIYVDSDKTEEFASRIIGLTQQLREDLQEDEAMKKDPDAFDFALEALLASEAASLKDASFREEQEIRIMRVNAEPEFHTPNKYGLVSRITVPLHEGAIKSITIGPGAHADQRLRSITEYTASVGMKRTTQSKHLQPEVYASTIPYRDW